MSIALQHIFISIHALREEGDGRLAHPAQSNHRISIHALREEGDPRAASFPSCALISIHALREEGDLTYLTGGTCQ